MREIENAVEFVHSLTGKKLEYAGWAAEILDLSFGDLVLHGMGCTRVIKNGDILISTLDYQSWDEVSCSHNDEYINIEKYNNEIVGGTVMSVELSECNDLILELDNGIRIECLIANAYPHYCEEREQWVLFVPQNKGGVLFLSVRNKSVSFRKFIP